MRVRPQHLLLVTLVVAALAAHGAARRGSGSEVPPDLSAVPRSVGPWTAVPRPVEEERLPEGIRADDGRGVLYRLPSGETLALYLAYYRNGRVWAYDHRGPEFCLRGSGWAMLGRGRRALAADGGEVEWLRYGRGGADQVVLFWTALPGGRGPAPAFTSQWRFAVQAFLRGRPDVLDVKILADGSGDTDAISERVGAFADGIAAWIRGAFR